MNAAPGLCPPPVWIPPVGTVRAVPAGTWWDAVRVRQDIAYKALEVLREQHDPVPGAVVADPGGAEPRLYFLIPVGRAGDWRAPGVRVLRDSCYVVVPDLYRTQPPGLHWAVPPTEHGMLTDPGTLWRALAQVTGPPP